MMGEAEGCRLKALVMHRRENTIVWCVQQGYVPQRRLTLGPRTEGVGEAR